MVTNYFNKIELRLIREKGPLYGLASVPKHIKSPGDIYKAFSWLADEIQENLYVLCLNSNNKVIGFYQAAKGTNNNVRTTMADIIRPALLTNAVSIILIHNHPSGGARASAADRRFTKDAKKAAELFGIRLFDHIIISGGGFESLQKKCFQEVKS